MNPLEKARRKKLKKKFKYGHWRWYEPERWVWLINPVMQTGLWTGALIFGAMSSLFASEITNVSFNLSLDSDANWHFVTFCIIFTILLFGFAMSSWVSRAQDALVIDKLLTMPPTDFWLYFGAEFYKFETLIDGRIASILEGDPDTKALEQYDEDIRLILDVIINLVKKWDTSNIRRSNVVYRANVMQVYYFDETSNEDLHNIVDQNVLTRFATIPFETHYSGFVILKDNTYTTTTKTGLPEPDQDRKPIAFPFTFESNTLETPILNNLKGAPETVVTKEASHVNNVAEIIEQYDGFSNLTEDRIKTEVSNYYSDEPDAKSILSIPMMQPETDKVGWVLNVYRDQSNLLFDGDKVPDFAQLIKPFTALLTRLLVAKTIT